MRKMHTTPMEASCEDSATRIANYGAAPDKAKQLLGDIEEDLEAEVGGGEDDAWDFKCVGLDHDPT